MARRKPCLAQQAGCLRSRWRQPDCNCLQLQAYAMVLLKKVTQMNKRAKENLWISGVFSIEFALISLAYLLCVSTTTNIYIAMLLTLFAFGVIYPLYLELRIFDTVLSILTTILYNFLWIFAIWVGLNIYFDLINITIGIISIILIWVLYDRLVPLKGVWGRKVLVGRTLYKYFPFILLVFAILSVPFWAYVLLIAPSLLNLTVVLLYFAALLYLVFDIWDDVKKKYYTEKVV